MNVYSVFFSAVSKKSLFPFKDLVTALLPDIAVPIKSMLFTDHTNGEMEAALAYPVKLGIK